MVLQHFQVESLLMFESEENGKVLCQLWPVELASSLPWHQTPSKNLDPERKVANVSDMFSQQPVNKFIFPVPSLFSHG